MNTSPTKSRSGKPVIVIEIGSDWLKIMEAVASRSRVTVLRLHLEPFEFVSPALSQSIRSVLKEKRFSRAPVIACLPRQMVTIRSLELPSTDPAEIADMIDFQAAKQTPYSKEEILTDYRIIGSEREGYTRVLLVIAQRSVLRQRFHILEEADVHPEQMTISSEGVLNWLVGVLGKNGRGATVGVLDMDSFYSDFMVVADDAPVFSRSILLGMNQLQGGSVRAVEKLVQEIRRSLDLCQTESPGRRPEKLLLAGAAAHMPGLDAQLSGALGLPCENKDSLEQARKMPKKGPDPAALNSVSLTPLLGMAMAPEQLDINLIPDSVRLRRALLSKARSLTALGMALMTVLVSASLFATTQYFMARSKFNDIRQRFEASEPVRLKIERMRDVVKKAEEFRSVRFAAVNLLSEIHPLMPSDVYLSAVEIDQETERLVIAGSAGSIKVVRALVNQLEGSSLLRDVKEEGSMSKDSRSGRFTFRVSCQLEGES